MAMLNKQIVIQTFSTNVGPPSYKLVSKPVNYSYKYHKPINHR